MRTWAGLDETLVSKIVAVRAAVDIFVEKAVLSNEVPSDRVSKALRHVRVGNYSKLRLLNLLDLDDSSTPDDPLSVFKKFTAAEAESKLNDVLKVLLVATAAADPDRAAASIKFFNALFKRIGDALKAGVKVPDCSAFYRATMAKVSAPARNFRLGAIGTGGGPSFNLEFVKNWSEARETFDEARQQAAATKAANEAVGQKRNRQANPGADPKKKGKGGRDPKDTTPPKAPGGGGAAAAGKGSHSALNTAAGYRHSSVKDGAAVELPKRSEDAAAYKTAMEAHDANHPKVQWGNKPGKKQVCFHFWQPQGCLHFKRTGECQFAHA